MIAETTRPVRRDLFRTGGYPGPNDPLDAAIAPLQVGVGPRRIKVVENAILVPGGGIIGPGGDTLPDSQLRRGLARNPHLGGGQLEPVSPTANIPGDALYLGWSYFHHFGHFLTDSMSRYWAVSHVPRDLPLLWVGWRNDRDPATALARGAAFGIDPDRMRLILEPTRVRRLLVPDVTFEERAYIHAESAAPFHALGQAIAGDVALTSQPLYLSRAGMATPKRHIAHEPLFEEFLRGQGWRVLRMDTLPAAEQIRAIRSHQVIAGPVGSAFHLTMFSEQRPSLHMFMYGHLQTSYILWADILQTPSSFFLCSRPRDPALGGPRWLVDLDMAAAAAYLRSEGLIGAAAPPVPPGSP